MRRVPIGCALVPLLLFAAGCTTLVTESRLQAEQTATAIDDLRHEVARLRQQVNMLEAQQQELLRQTQGAVTEERAQTDRLAERVGALERRLDASDAARAADREQIISHLSSRMSDILRTRSAAPSSSRVERGYEHVVQSGETLSAIAAAYKARPKDIIEANGLKNPDAIRVGQKLFIPSE